MARRDEAAAPRGETAAGGTEGGGRASWALRLIRNVLLWLVPLSALWWVATPYYNRFVTVAAGNLLKIVESPNVTRLVPVDAHYVSIQREDFPPAKADVYRVRVTDLHFHLVLLAALFLAVPGVPLKARLGPLGWALLVAVFFHILDLFFWVKFVYATQLGEWTQQHYGELGQNFWGMAKHLIDLPFKLALPLALWVGFYYRKILPERQ